MGFYDSPVRETYLESRLASLTAYVHAANENRPIPGPYTFMTGTTYDPARILADVRDMYRETDPDSASVSPELTHQRLIGGVLVNLPGLHDLVTDEHYTPESTNDPSTYERAA